ncbi:MAG: hypothetical protein Q7T20_03715 [Saprospiraceae bacterium]|nr:hypothetical protein [Saprospiraceae bacterium]
MNIRLSLFEIFLLQTIGWLGLWLISDFLAALLTIIIGAIVSAVLIIALISEIIERSKVPRKYFQVMGLSILSLALAAVIYVTLLGGQMDFLTR